MCAVAVTADGEKVAFLGGFLTDLTKRLRIWAAVFSKIQENFEQMEAGIAQIRCFYPENEMDVAQKRNLLLIIPPQNTIFGRNRNSRSFP